MLLLYIAEKERWVVSAFTSSRNTFLALKAANLKKIMNAKLMLRGDTIISYLTSRSSSLVQSEEEREGGGAGAADDKRSNDAIYNFFLSERLDYFISVKDWVRAVSMQDQAVEMAAKALEDWPEGARRIYRSLARVYEEKEDTQKTLDFLTLLIAVPGAQESADTYNKIGECTEAKTRAYMCCFTCDACYYYYNK